jgi:hypothetical protein
MANSLDIVDSCLTQIYECRKTLLQRKMQNVKSRIESRRALQEKLSNIHKKDDFHLEANLEDDEFETLAKNISSLYISAPKPSSPGSPLSRKPKNLDSASSGSANTLTKNDKRVNRNSSNDEEDEDDDTDEEKTKEVSMTTEQLNELRQNFDKEIKELERKYIGSELEGDIDEAIDALITKYFSEKLDCISASAEVSTLRQYISQRIEYVAGLEAPPPKDKSAPNIDETEGVGAQDNATSMAKKAVRSIDVNDPNAIKARLRTMMKRDNRHTTRENDAVSTAALDKPNLVPPDVDSSDEDEDEEDDKHAVRGRESPSRVPRTASSSSKRVTFVDDPAVTTIPPLEGSTIAASIPKGAARAITPNTQKKQQEKLRIKEQYEKYLQSKQNHQSAHQEVNDRENLAADIQSVLASLRNSSLSD